MLKNKNILLIIAIIALGLIAWGLFREGSLGEKTKVPRVKFSSQVDRIEISQKESSTVLIKEDDDWFVQEGEVNYPANQSSLEEVTSILEDFPISEIVSQNPEKFADFQIDDETALGVRWFIGDQERGQLYLGKSDYRRQGDYVRVGDKEIVYLTVGNIRFNFSRPEFRDLSVLEIERDGIKQIAWKYGEESFVLMRREVEVEEEEGIEDSSTEESKEEKWVLRAEEEEQEIDDSKISSLLNQVSNINARNILPKGEEKDYGFAEPFLQLTITTPDQDYILILGNQADEEPAYYSQISGKEEWVYLLNIALIDDQLVKKVEDFVGDF